MEDIEDLLRHRPTSSTSTSFVREKEEKETTARLEDVALIPSSAFSLDGTTRDNCAVATKRIERHTTIRHERRTFRISHTVLEGHRFCICEVKRGEHLLSWGMPFAIATEHMLPGQYVCNDRIVEALRGRGITYALPKTSNFRDILPTYDVRDAVVAERQIELLPPEKQGTFDGYLRGGDRGVGTRNMIVVIGITAQAGTFAIQLANRLRPHARGTIDDVVAVAHAELGECTNGTTSNNEALVMRTLAGFTVHPNVGGALLVGERHRCDELMRTLRTAPYDALLPHCRVAVLEMSGRFNDDLAMGEKKLLPIIDASSRADRRTKQPLSKLCLALQCGGSDAFSGVSGNPLAGSAARELIRHGGVAVQAETDELMGAEAYFLRSCRKGRAGRFLKLVDRFKRRLGNHGHTAEANPSGGNNYRGLYNIALKSLGASMKKAPDVRLDDVVEYGERLRPNSGHFVFMDSPGNDLESIAGQVAAGCNAIFFTTGNGSVTNFPFVPTQKIITTTRRYAKLTRDMDFNAGKLNDGESFDRLTKDLFDQLVDVSSGTLTKGERAGHSQCSIWRDWFVPDKEIPWREDARPEEKESARVAASKSHDHAPSSTSHQPLTMKPPTAMFASRAADGFAVDAIGLILPTSLCSGEIARMCAKKLNASLENERRSGTSSLASTFTRFVALPHTEGCGSTGNIFKGILGGTMGNDVVRYGVALEHGCEKHHNDAFQAVLKKIGLPPEHVGFASVQQDGGVDATLSRVDRLFRNVVRSRTSASMQRVPLKGRKCKVGIGLLVSTRQEGGGRLHPTVAEAFRLMSRATISSWGSVVVVPQKSALLRNASFLDDALETDLGRHDSRRLREAGIAIISDGADGKMSVSESLALLGSERSVQILVAYCPHMRTLPAHPLLSTIVLGSTGDADIRVRSDPTTVELDHDRAYDLAKAMCDMLRDVASGNYVPKANRHGNVLFQLPRGKWGVSA